MTINQNLVPIVIEKSGRTERAYDIYSRLLKDRIVFLGGPLDDATANLIIAQKEDHFKKEKKKLNGTEVFDKNTDSVLITNSINSLLNNYYYKGYLTARIDSTIIDSNVTKVYYYKGEIIRWGEIKINVDEIEQLKREGINTKGLTGKPVILKTLMQLIDKTIGYYEKNGYPFIKLELQPVH